jgi:DNA invertase Pin-like site-specific DNA recombinase
MKIGYARVSTREQNLDMQIFALQDAGCEKIYEEVVSGAKADRPVLNALIKQLRDGDVIVVWKLDRLGRSLRRLGGRPRGIPKASEPTACAAETLYRDGKLSVMQIAKKLSISKNTLYKYLRYRNVEISKYEQKT